MLVTDSDRAMQGRVPPHNLDAEAVVLSDLLMAPEHIAEQRDSLCGATFYSDANREIYLAVLATTDAGVGVDLVSVAAFLRQRGKLATIGGARYLGDIADATPTVANVADHVRVIVELEQRRRVIAVAHTIAAEGYLDRHCDGERWTTSAAERMRVAAGGSEKHGAFPVLSSEDIFGQLEPIPWLCESLGIAAGAPCMAAGYGYSGKTAAAQSMAISVAAGVNVWGRFAAANGRVLHVDYEQGARLTRERYQRLARGMRLGFDDLAGQLEVVCLPALYMDHAAAEETLARACDGVALCVIDSFRACAPSVDENSSEARLVLDMLARVSDRTGAAFLMIHHARKSQPGQSDSAKMSVRGSGALFDACASVLVFQASKGEPTIVTHEKNRLTGEQHDDVALEIGDVEDDGDRRWGLTVHAVDAADVQTEREERRRTDLDSGILEFVRRNTGCSTGEIKHGVRGKAAAIQAALEAMVRGGRVQKLTAPGGRGRVNWAAKEAL
jgi:hypothetical protein